MRGELSCDRRESWGFLLPVFACTSIEGIKNKAPFLKPSHWFKFPKLLESHESRWFNVTTAEILRSFALFCREIDVSLLEL